MDRVCSDLFLTHAAKDSDDNLAFVRNRLLKSEAELPALLDLYHQMRSGKMVRDDETNPLCSILKLSGVARVEAGALQVRNRIYEHVFDKNWVETHMPDAEKRRQNVAYRRGVLRTLGFSAAVLVLVGSLAVFGHLSARKAQMEAGRALLAETRATRISTENIRNLYFANMHVIQSEVSANNFVRVDQLLEETRSSPYRGFEWDYWNKVSHPGAVTLDRNHNAIYFSTYSHNGRFIASGGASGFVCLYDSRSHKQIRRFIGHKLNVWSAAFSPDDSQLLTLSSDGTARLWDVRTGAILHVASAPRQFLGASFRRDGRAIALGDLSGVLRVYDENLGRVSMERSVPGVIGYLDYSPNGRAIVVGMWGGQAEVVDSRSGQTIFPLKGHTDSIQTVTYSRDGSHIVTSSLDCTVRIWNAGTGDVLSILRNESPVTCATFSPDGSKVVAGDLRHVVRVWDWVKGRQIYSLRGHGAILLWAEFSPDQRFILTCSQDGTSRIWPARAPDENVEFRGHTGPILSLQFSEDGNTLLSGSDDNTAISWDVPSRSVRARFKGHSNGIKIGDAVELHGLRATFLSGSSRVITASVDDSVRVWNANSGSSLRAIKGTTNCTYALAASKKLDRFVISAKGFSVQEWNSALRAPLGEYIGHSDEVVAAAYSPDGKWLVTGSWDWTAKVWDTATHALAFNLVGHSNGISALAISPDGEKIITGSDDGTAKIWGMKNGRLLYTIANQGGYVLSTAFAPDGKRFAIGLDNGDIHLFDTSDGSESLTLKTGFNFCRALAFSPNGKSIVGGTQDGVIRIFQSLP